MGNKMTSTPYGLKVKEHTNHADYKDVFDKTVFKIYYNESTHVWSIIANYDRLWSEGTQYDVGDTILSFTNTSNQEKTVLGQYDQEGTEVYRNIMYRIKCYQGEAGEGRTKQLIQITGGYSPKTYDKETVCTDILHTHVSVYYNGKWHKAMYLVYDNASIAGCWIKKVGSLAITYAYPYWFLMCTKAGLKQGDRTYAARELIRSWSQDDYIDMSFKEYKIRSKTKLGKGSYEKGEYLVKTIPSEDSIEVDFIVNGKIENKDTIILGISDVPYDFYNIRINYESNEWSLISINGHISYNKHNYKKDAVICTLNKDEQITVTLIDNNDRYEKQQELNNDYEETVYDIVGLPDATYITVKNQTVVQELNPETGRTEKVYIDFDEKTIYQSDTMPSDFYNIRFIYTSSDNKWTIYSLCDYIKYGGRTYTKNKSILSFGTDEYDPEDPHPEVHLEIKDETEKYEIESTTTYTVKSVQVSNVSYKLWTVTIDKSLKIEKTVDTTVEPWISLRYYEAMYEPVVIDDLILEFSNVDMKWYLKSNNDNLYCSGTNYQKGELITYWDYDYIQNLKYITVLSGSSEYGIELKKLTSGDVPYISEDIDEIYDEGIKICYSASKGLWEIVSVDDETYHNGIQFLEGQTIVSFKDKTILDQFTILVKKIIPGEEEYDNVMYTCYTGVDLINGITTLTVNGMSWANKTATDANKSTIVTKDMARSMYGYIWQKEETPPPGPWPSGYVGDIIIIQDPSDNRWGTLCYIVPNELYHRKILPTASRQPWLRIYLSEFSYFFNTENEFYVPFGINEIFWYCSVSSSNDYIFQTQRRMTTSFYIPQTQGYFNNFDMVGKFIEKESCVSIYSLGTYGDLGDRWLFLIMKAEYSSSGWINVLYQQAIDIAVYDWQQALQTDFDQLNAAGYVIWASYMNPYTKVNSLNKAVYFCCPRLNLNVDLFKYLTFRFYQETLSLIEVPSSITNEIKSSVVPHHEKNIEVNVRTIYFNNTFYLIIYAGVHENFNGNGSYYPPETWDSDYFISPHVFLLTYNDISGFHLYNLDNDVFGTADRVSPILETPIGAGRSYYVLEKYYSVPTRLYTYQNELYISDIRYDEIVDGDLGKSIVYKRCIYKLDEQNHTFIKVKEFKIEDTISVYDIVNKENVEINICQFLLRYDFITHNSENFTHLEHIQNVSRSLRRKDLVNGLYFIYLKNRTQTIYYFTNPLFDEDIMNFCFPANEIGFRDRYSEDGNF